PILVTEVLGTEPLVAPPFDVRDADHLYKITPDLWSQLGENRLVRVELILTTTPRDGAWRETLQGVASSLTIESHLGPYVIGLVNTADVRGLAALPIVSTVRLPLTPLVGRDPGLKLKADNAALLRDLGLELTPALDQAFVAPLNAVLKKPRSLR